MIVRTDHRPASCVARGIGPAVGQAATIMVAAVLMTPAAALHLGNEVRSNTNVNVRTAPAGATAGTRATGDLGVVVGGPVTAALPGGNPLVWWKIDWASGVDGWSFEGGLDQRTLTEGIDVSNWQGDIDWARVASEGGRVFAIAKATEGSSFIDAKFTRNMGQGRAAGVLMGAYHFARPSATPTLTADALAEARHFVRALHPWLDDGGLRPVLDLEDGSALGKSALSSWSRTFLNEVRRLTTADSIVYTSRTYAQNYVDADLAAFPLWIAVPNTTPGANTFNLGPWPRWALQQYSWTGQVPGIAGDVDQNAFSGDKSQLQTLVLPPLTHTIGELKAIPDVVERGAGLRISARVTSSHTRRLVLGATIFPAGSTTGGTSDPLYDRAVELPQGTANATRSFTLPAGLAPGDYDLVMALYLDLDNSGTINSGDLQVGSSRRQASALRVEATTVFATWAAAAGLDEVTGSPAADPDDDGVENLMEYAFGTPPTRAQTESPLTVTIEPASDNPNARVLRLRFPRWPDRTDLIYSVQRTMNPAETDWITVASAAGGVPFSGPGFQETGTAPVIVILEIPVVATNPAYLRIGVTPR